MDNFLFFICYFILTKIKQVQFKLFMQMQQILASYLKIITVLRSAFLPRLVIVKRSFTCLSFIWLEFHNISIPLQMTTKAIVVLLVS